MDSIDKLQILNSIFNSDNDITVVSDFLVIGDEPEKQAFWGTILLQCKSKESLHFDVLIPLSYPLSNDTLSMRFFCKDNIDAFHVNYDNSICIHTAKNSDFVIRLQDEIKNLKEWSDKFYIGNEPKERYEYPILTPFDNSCYLFTNVSNPIKPNDFGDFRFSLFANNNATGRLANEQVYILQIGKQKCHWAEHILSRKYSVGHFVYLAKEPIGRSRKVVSTWEELQQFLPIEFIKLLGKSTPNPILVLVGYPLPNSNESHWHVIKIDANELAVSVEKINNGNYNVQLSSTVPIRWCKTINSSYYRFFGRGKLSDKITQAKCLIVGLGAIGSSLAKILVRAGCIHVDLCDIDIIEPGNICRSEYYIVDNGTYKCFALRNHLQFLSPFVEPNCIPVISKILDDESVWLKSKKLLEKYNYIFDCSTDTELSYVFDKLDLKPTVINLSITDKAKELVCVVGGNNITTLKNEIFSRFSVTEEIVFYEGAGCWNPTFEASYFDINGLLNLAVQNLNKAWVNNNPLRCFIIKKEEADFSNNLITSVF